MAFPARVAIIGAKGVGKDFFAKSLIPELSKNGATTERFAFADILKEECHVAPAGYSGPWEYGFLEADFTDLVSERKIPELLPEDAAFVRGISSKKYSELTLSERLRLIEILKNAPSFRTRSKLQTFSDYVKWETGNPFYFSEKLAPKLEGPLSGKNVVNTDPRYVSEIFDLFLSDFLFVRLWNPNVPGVSVMEEPWKEHVSETEVSLRPDVRLGIRADYVPERGCRHPSTESVLSWAVSVSEAAKAFGWYRESDKKIVRKMKELLAKDSKTLAKQRAYSDAYVEYRSKLLAGTPESKLSSEIEACRRAWLAYSERKDPYLSAVAEMTARATPEILRK